MLNPDLRFLDALRCCDTSWLGTERLQVKVQVKATWNAVLTEVYSAAGHSSDPTCHALSASFFVDDMPT